MGSISENARESNCLMNGANPNFIYGGKTSGAVHEIATDQIPAYEIWNTLLTW